MANRRFNAPPQRGNRGFLMQNSGGMNPWQGGGPTSSGPMPNNNIQAQLALALSSLLQPQQPVNDSPPSLLSLNTTPGYYNQGGGYGSGGRFGNRGGPSGRDMRRPEPYNKNRGNGPNWRDNKGGKGFNNRNTPRFNRDRRPDNKKPDEHRKKEEKDREAEESRDEGESEKKREWKSEKKTGDEESATVAATEEGEKSEKDEGKKEPKKDKSKYAGLPPSLLHCFVCNKSMWDGESFQNHVGGTAHMQMLNSAEESFRIIVGILRENMRLAEEKDMIELNRMVRSNRKFVPKMKEPESHCNMCDMKFMGKIVAHRKTAGHQRLKRYLHPKCEMCALEFPSRIEWVEHRFTPDHLHKLNEVMEKKCGGADGNVIVVQEEKVEVPLEPLLEENLSLEAENPVLELDEDLANLNNRVPAYRSTREVATKSLKPANGFICELCHRFFESEELSKAHLRTEQHYLNFVTTVKRKFKRQAADRADDDGNWKRRKTDKEGDEGKNADGGDGEGEGDETNGEGNDMYDPEEACNENEETGTSQEMEDSKEVENDDPWESNQESTQEPEPEIKKEPEPVVEIKEEPVNQPEAKSPPKRGQQTAIRSARNGTPRGRGRGGRR